MAYMIIYF